MVATPWVSLYQCTGNYFQAWRGQYTSIFLQHRGTTWRGCSLKDVGRVEAGGFTSRNAESRMRLSTKTVEGRRRDDGTEKWEEPDRIKRPREIMRSTGPHEERCPKRETIFTQAEGRRLEIDGDRQRSCMPGVFVRVITNDGSEVFNEWWIIRSNEFESKWGTVEICRDERKYPSITSHKSVLHLDKIKF